MSTQSIPAAARAGPTRESARAAALVLICLASAIAAGRYDRLAMVLLLAGVAATVPAVVGRHGAAFGRAHWAALVAALGWAGVVAAQHLQDRRASGAAVVLAVAAVAVVATPVAAMSRAALALAAAAGAAVWILPWHWGSGMVDVFDIVRDGARELAHGVNPYGNHRLVTLQEIGLHFLPVQIAFSYGPGVLLLAMPFALLGDVRPLAVICAAAIAAGTMSLARRSPWSPDRRTVAALCLVFPLAAVMIDYGWVDIYLMGGVVAWLALRGNHPRAAAVVLGLAFATKPATVAPLLLPLFVWSPRARREIVWAGVVAAAITLPFVAITGVHDFYDAVAGFFSRMQPRATSLTVNAALINTDGRPLPGFVGILAVLLTCALVLRRRPQDLADALTAGAAITTVAFLFAKWAFLNYYFDVVVLVLIALLTRGVPLEERREAAATARVAVSEALPAAASTR